MARHKDEIMAAGAANIDQAKFALDQLSATATIANDV